MYKETSVYYHTIEQRELKEIDIICLLSKFIIWLRLSAFVSCE